ncbi:peptidyl-tRNA hydrolase protein 1 [Rhizophlyctis rosea]|nr:peptidyl-tRNA hydrolase protein 1 [Rhizophlyctis rosea]
MSVKRALVIGLGNHLSPNTRHSVGYLALNHLVESLVGPDGWALDRHLNGYLAEGLVERPKDPPTSTRKKSLAKEESNTAPDQPKEDEEQSAYVVFMKPKTFMNFSGGPVLAAAKEYKFHPSEIFVVHDDLELDIGKVSLKRGGSAGGHNGLKSITASLRTDEYRRLRMGIGRPESKDPGLVAKFVLSAIPDNDQFLLKSNAFPDFEKTLLKEIFRHS